MYPPMIKDGILYRKVADPDKPGKFKKDEHGIFIVEPLSVKCAVDVKTTVIELPDGTKKQCFLDVDFPADVYLDYGYGFEFTDSMGKIYSGEILTIEENTDPLGITVLSRFCGIG